MADYSQLSHGERAMASLLEVFRPDISQTLENEYVIALDEYSSAVVSRAVADFKGLTDWRRNNFYIGKMPKLDELLNRVREIAATEREIKRLSSPRIVQAPFQHKTTPEHREALVRAKTVPLKKSIEDHQDGLKLKRDKGGAPVSVFADEDWYKG